MSLEFRRDPHAINWGIVEIYVDIYRWYLKLWDWVRSLREQEGDGVAREEKSNI